MGIIIALIGLILIGLICGTIFNPEETEEQRKATEKKLRDEYNKW